MADTPSKRKRSKSPTPNLADFEAEPQTSDANISTQPGQSIGFGCDGPTWLFLTNSFPSRIVCGGTEFRNAEAIFQASKFEQHPNLQLAIAKTKWPGDVIDKARAWEGEISETWLEQRLPVMKGIQELKYTQNSELRARLLQTGDAELFYISSKDPFFGVGPDAVGENHLGKILMDLRTSFRKTPCPALLSIGANLSEFRPNSRSIVWCANTASEKWYPAGTISLREVTIEPAIEDAPASKPAFLHSIVHGDVPWTICLLFQIRGAAKEGTDGPMLVNIQFDQKTTGRSSSTRQENQKVRKELLIIPADTTPFLKGKAVEDDVYLIRLDLKLRQHTDQISIWLLPNKSAKRPEKPDYLLVQTVAVAP
ncbi:unnamed protein product [Tilletia laevis]|uniref:NADAR domain-containing protein n=2 Tax=Tilletia TaxID=13289 RepID=A0A177VH01_9BASI|nr:hypothetical protein CF336_g5232 [Tilletia laevis]KAE8258652.1 hypothetical protein A4X03_0g4320 [Tilletia caries]CAD6939510.1 unnamed protein product [Tilletia controversa]KAE8207279.1 hypothetical protein CF335_g1254 [Tilletia laevis]CAD6886548.1 unnamed protein product [Tilletia caries]